MKRLPKVSRRKIGSKPRARDILSAKMSQALHELMLEEDRQWLKLVAQTHPELNINPQRYAEPPPKRPTAAQIFDRKIARRIIIEKQPVTMRGPAWERNEAV